MAYQGLARRLKFLTRSLLRHGPAHVVEVFRQAAVRGRYARSPVPPPTRETLLAAFGSSNDEAMLAALSRSAARRLPMSLAQRREFFTSLLERSQGYDAILEEAERFSDGRFLALGVSTLEPGGHYDWHRDYGSTKVWDRVRFDRVRFMSGDGADVKYPWELSRLQWIAWLGKAYWISSNAAWSREFVRQIDSWRAANPVNTGVNWSMPMEVGIRAFWLAMGFGLFNGAPGIDPAWWIDYLRLAWAHGRYLEHNLEYFSNLTNHYVADCFGLVAVGVLFADTDDGRRWLTEGRRRLEREIGHQVLADGAHYERSLPYHRLVLEMYLVAAILLERSALPFSSDTRAAIERMSELHVDVMAPDGSIPQIGDADDGLILRTTQDGPIYDGRDVAALAAVLFARADFAAAAGAFTQGAIMLTGGAGYETFRGLAMRPRTGSRLYRDGGFAVMRSDAMHVVADVGPIGLHGNNDTLSFTLADGVGMILIDPGTYCYNRSPRLRNELRSTAAHDAPCIDGREIAEYDGLWRVRSDRTGIGIVEWSAEPPRLRARHHAYRDDGIVIEREWRLDGGGLTVIDRIGGSGTHEVATRFTLAGGLAAVRRDRGTVVITRDGAEIAELESSHPLAIVDGWHSPSYGIAASTTIIELRGRFELPLEIQYLCRLRTS